MLTCTLQLTSNHSSLLLALISLRLFPMSPNWLLNVISPLLGIPLPLFFISVLLGNSPTIPYLCSSSLWFLLVSPQLISVLRGKIPFVHLSAPW